MGFNWGGKKWRPAGIPNKQPKINQSIEELLKPLSEKTWKGNVWGSQIMNVEKETTTPDVTPSPTPSVTPTQSVTPSITPSPTPSASPVITPFIMSIDTTQSGSASNTFVLPTDGSGYNATVNWGDGNSETISGTPGNVTHVYSSPGTYNVSITGTFPTIYFNNAGDKSKVMNITQWGSIAWSTWYLSFLGCNNMVITALDAPNLSNVTNCYGTFGVCSSLTNDPMNHWDMSNVEVMWAMFVASGNFNSNISNWDVSSVTNFLAMFEGCSSFNQNIGSWNVSSATNMDQMFNSAGAFNQNLSGWCVTNIPTEPSSFGGAFSPGFKPVWGTCPPPPSATPTPTPTSSVTPTQSVTPSLTPTPTPSITPSPSAPLLVADQLYQGGRIAYLLAPGDPGYDANVQHGFIMTTGDTAADAVWGCSGTNITGTTSTIGSGPTNTQKIVEQCSTAGIAARLCSDLVQNGYSDWYLPSADEWDKINGYYSSNLIPNLNLTLDTYWTSTNYDSTQAWKISICCFQTSTTDTKISNHRVRAIRSF